MIRSRFAVLLVLAAVGLAGSASAAAADGKGRAKVPTVRSLLDKQFRSVKVKGNPMIGDKQMSMRFFMHSNFPNSRPERPMLGFSAGCNSMGGKFRIRRGRLSLFGGVSGTDMGCSRNPDPWLTKKLRKGLVVRVKGNWLILSRPAERVRFVLVRIPPAEPRTPATTENLEGKSFESVEVKGLELGAAAHLTFTTGPLTGRDAEPKPVRWPLLQAHLDCNSAGGEYRIKYGRLVWIKPVWTLQGCPGSKEKRLFRFLRTQPRIRFAGPRLILFKGTRRMILRQVKS